MAKVVFNRLFLANLKDILSYIDQDNSKHVADQVETTIFDAIRLLEYFPLYGRIIYDSNGKEVLHSITVGCYLIIYSYTNDTVFVEEIYDSRRDHRTKIQK